MPFSAKQGSHSERKWLVAEVMRTLEEGRGWYEAAPLPSISAHILAGFETISDHVNLHIFLSILVTEFLFKSECGLQSRLHLGMFSTEMKLRWRV